MMTHMNNKFSKVLYSFADSQLPAIGKRQEHKIERYRNRDRVEKAREDKGNTLKGTLSEPRVHSNLVCPTSLTFFRSVSGSNGCNI